LLDEIETGEWKNAPLLKSEIENGERKFSLEKAPDPFIFSLFFF